MLVRFLGYFFFHCPIFPKLRQETSVKHKKHAGSILLLDHRNFHTAETDFFSYSFPLLTLKAPKVLSQRMFLVCVFPFTASRQTEKLAQKFVQVI